MSLSRNRTESSSSTGNAAQHSMSPRLPRKSRQPGAAGAYNSASKLDHTGSLQVIGLYYFSSCWKYEAALTSQSKEKGLSNQPLFILYPLRYPLSLQEYWQVFIPDKHNHCTNYSNGRPIM